MANQKFNKVTAKVEIDGSFTSHLLVVENKVILTTPNKEGEKENVKIDGDEVITIIYSCALNNSSVKSVNIDFDGIKWAAPSNCLNPVGNKVYFKEDIPKSIFGK